MLAPDKGAVWSIINQEESQEDIAMIIRVLTSNIYAIYGRLLAAIISTDV